MMLKVMFYLVFSSVTSFLLPFRWEYIVVSFDLLSTETNPLLPTSIMISSQVNPMDYVSLVIIAKIYIFVIYVWHQG